MLVQPGNIAAQAITPTVAAGRKNLSRDESVGILLGMAAALKRQWLSLLPEAVRQAQAAAPVSGPAYSVDWFSIDGGGGSSAGGNFSLSATIGQADAGASTGGNYTLLGAFLPGALKPVNQYIPLVRK